MGRKSRLKREARALGPVGPDGLRLVPRMILQYLCDAFERDSGRKPVPGDRFMIEDQLFLFGPNLPHLQK
jgi:hypothetical protein